MSVASLCVNIKTHYLIGHGLQFSEKSWWPKQSTWKVSGLNVGHWSRDCETWYQMRLEAIRENLDETPLRTAADWRRSLKFNHKSQKFVNAYNDAAAMYLSRHPH